MNTQTTVQSDSHHHVGNRVERFNLMSRNIRVGTDVHRLLPVVQRVFKNILTRAADCVTVILQPDHWSYSRNERNSQLYNAVLTCEIKIF